LYKYWIVRKIIKCLAPDAITPMTLGNMRENGVRSLMVYSFAAPARAAATP
jgi:hypothetical protein